MADMVTATRQGSNENAMSYNIQNMERAAKRTTGPMETPDAGKPMATPVTYSGSGEMNITGTEGSAKTGFNKKF